MLLGLHSMEIGIRHIVPTIFLRDHWRGSPRCRRAPQSQDTVEQFFRGKTINIYVGSSAGGGYDTYARLVARHFGK